MPSPEHLLNDFRNAFNDELAAMGCRLRIADRTEEGYRNMLLLAADGSELGWVPDHSDAAVIAAFEQILLNVERPCSAGYRP